MAGSAVQPTQKIDAVIKTPPYIAGISRFSIGIVVDFVLQDLKIACSITIVQIAARHAPPMAPMKARPARCGVKP